MNLAFSRFGKLTELGRRVYLFIAKGPAYHYTYGCWRIRRWLNGTLNKLSTQSDRAFLSQLNLENPKLYHVSSALVKEDLEEAKNALYTYLRARTKPYFFFGSEDVEQISALINNEQKDTVICAADRICRNIYQFRRSDPVEFDNGVDWNYRHHDNLDWTWDLNRHTYFDTLGRAYWYTGDECYAQKFRELLLDWLAKNPARVNQSNWSSVFEVAFRINVWLWAFYYFRDAAAFDKETCVAFMKGLLAHGRYLDAHLELHVQNNHLLLEAKALAMLGVVFPEFKQAKRWRHRGLKILFQQITKQVCPDGVHGERTTFYHRVITGELLELLVLLENNQASIPPEIIKAFSRMVEFELWVTKPNGLIPLLNDSALEDTYPRFSTASGGPVFLGRSDLKSVAAPLNEGDIWLLGSKRVTSYPNLPTESLILNSRAFPDGGYFVMRQGQSSHAPYLIFDSGPFGHAPVPSHGHADALSFELYAYGNTLLVDPGVYGTRLGAAWRNFFRSSRAHNTIVVDNQDQSTLVDTWRVYRPACTKLHQWVSNERFDIVDASHDGYKRLSKPITHRRQIFFHKPEYWIVIDLLLGYGNHEYDLFFHFAADMKTHLERSTGTVLAGNEVGSGLIIAPWSNRKLDVDIVSGATDPIQGWISVFSGEKYMAPVVCYRYVGLAPVKICTVLYPYAEGKNPSVTVSSLEVQISIEDRLVTVTDLRLTGLKIELGDYVDYLIIDRTCDRSLKNFAGFRSDAYFIHLRHNRRKELLKVAIEAGCQLFSGEQPLLSEEELTSGFVIFNGRAPVN